MKKEKGKLITNTSKFIKGEGLEMDLVAKMVQESVSAAIAASSQVMSKLIMDQQLEFQAEIKQEVYDIKNVITEQEIRHQKQMSEARDLIGLRQRNVASLVKLLKAKLSDLADERISAESYFYISAKEKLFRKYDVQHWEQLPIHLYNAVHADIDSIEDLEDIHFE